MLPLGPDINPLFGALPVAESAWTEDDFFVGLGLNPLALTVGPNFDSKVINLAGFNAFVGVLKTTGTTGTLTISILMLHPVSQAVIATRQIAAGVAVNASAVATFGAYN